MKQCLITITGLLGLALTVCAANAATSGYKGAWGWNHNTAWTKFENGLAVEIVFEPETCDSALLGVSGNNKIRKIGLQVDGDIWGEVSASTGDGGSGVWLNKTALKALKNGNYAEIRTDRGALPMSLDGSAAAFNGAWDNCEALQRKPLQILEPEGVAFNAENTEKNSQGTVQVIKEKDGDLLAAGDVVFYFGNISQGDDVLLQKLVGKMEAEGIPFKSLVFVKNPGGSLAAAMRIGDFVRQKRANTAAYDLCASACIYAFAGGVTRTSHGDTRFGLHQVSYADGSQGTLVEGQKLAAVSYAYLEKKGVHPKIAMWEAEIEPDSMRWISQYEAKGLQLVTNIKENYDVPVPESRAVTPHSGLSESVSRLVLSPADNGAAEVGSVYPARYSQISGPSFRCGGQLQPVESIICDDPDLARSDGIMGEIYKDLRSTLRKSDADSLRAEQRGWIKQRNRACPASVSDLRSAAQVVHTASCVRSATERRIAALWAILKPIGRK